VEIGLGNRDRAIKIWGDEGRDYGAVGGDRR